MISRKTKYLAAAFLAADTLITCGVSAAVLYIFKCDNSLCAAGIIAAGVLAIQLVLSGLILSAAEDLTGPTGLEDR